jgi:hypothetical protein
MARRKSLRISTHLLPTPKKIVKRGIYEMVSAATGGNTKPRDYGKRIREGKY